MKPINSSEKKMRQEKQFKRGGERKYFKDKIKTAVSLLNPKTILNFFPLRIPKPSKLMIASGLEGHKVYDP